MYKTLMSEEPAPVYHEIPAQPSDSRLAKVMAWIFFALMTLLGGCLAWMLVVMAYHGWITDIVLQHFACTVGLPLAAATSVGIVLLLRTIAGPIKFEGLTIKFEGASGPIIMWVLCFIAISVAIGQTWDLEKPKLGEGRKETSRQHATHGNDKGSSEPSEPAYSSQGE